MFDYISAIEGGVVGLIVTGLAMWHYVSSRITAEEAQRIYTKAKTTIDEYEKAKADGALTTDEKLKLADEAIGVIQEIIKDLES